MTQLHTKAQTIQQRAQALADTMPVHLKLLPEIKQTLSLINEISEVLVQLTHSQGEQDHARS